MGRMDSRTKMMFCLERSYPSWITASALARDMQVSSTEGVSRMLAQSDRVESRNRSPKEWRLIK